MSRFDADDIDRLVESYEKKYEKKKKECQILKAIRGRWAPSKPSINSDAIIREVWQAELKGLKGSSLEAKMKALRNTFRVQLYNINDHLQQLYQGGENPQRIGLVKNTFAVLDNTEVQKSLEQYAREIKSPWLIKEFELQITLKDAQGRNAVVSRRMVVVPLLPGLKDFTHVTGSDGTEYDFSVSPGWIVGRDIESGVHHVVQGFGNALPPNEPQELTLTYMAEEAYMNKHEYFIFGIHYPTAKERVIVNFPLERPCVSFSALRLIGRSAVEELEATLNEQRTKLTWEIINPPHKETYKLIWKW